MEQIKIQGEYLTLTDALNALVNIASGQAEFAKWVLTILIAYYSHYLLCKTHQ